MDEEFIPIGEEDSLDDVFLQSDDESRCIIHCSKVNDDTLVALQKVSTWDVLLNAAKIRNRMVFLIPQKISFPMVYNTNSPFFYTNITQIQWTRINAEKISLCGTR